MKKGIIDCKNLAEKILNNTKISFDKMRLNKKPKGLAIIIVGENYASLKYVQKKEELCRRVGIDCFKFIFEENIKEKNIINCIKALNLDNNIGGIIVQLPLPQHLNPDYITSFISKNKDIDCLNPTNKGLLWTKPYIKPCTPKGCISFLKDINVELKGKNCCIIGRSEIVGKPLIPLLLNEDATVFSLNSHTKDIKTITKLADIIFVAVGKENFLTKDMVKKGAIVLDIGINRDKDGNICGDVAKEVSEIALVTKVPSGVGLLTTSSLIDNLKELNYKNN